MADSEEKSLMETIKDSYVENGGEVIWNNDNSSKIVILVGKFLPELVILTQEGLGVRVAKANGRCNASGLPARIYYDAWPFENKQKENEDNP